MHGFIKRYAASGKFRAVNTLSLLAWRATPNLLRQKGVEWYYATHKRKLPVP